MAQEIVQIMPPHRSYLEPFAGSLAVLFHKPRSAIETVTFPDLGVVVICNEEGRLLGLPYCCTIRGVDFVGCVAVFCPDGDTLRDVQYELRKWKEIVAD